MDGVIGWDLTDEDLRKLRLLEHIAANGRSPNLCTLPEWAQDTSSVEYADARSHLSELNSTGYLEMWDPAAMPNLMISGIGLAAYSKIAAYREDRRARDAGLHDALLAWLDEESLAGTAVPYLSLFRDSRFGRWFGQQFTEREVALASTSLRDLELIGGTGALGGGIIRPTLRPEGRRLSRSGRSVFDDDRAAGGDTFTITQTAHNLNSQVGGRASTQTMTVTLSNEQQGELDQLVDLLRELSDVVPGADDAANDLRSAASSSDPALWRRALVGAQGAAMAAIGTDVGQSAMHVIHSLMSGTS